MSPTAPSTDPPASKGAGFTTVVAVLRESAPEARFEAYLASLPPATAALARTPPMAIAWLPIEHFYALIDRAQRVLLSHDPDGIAEVAYKSIGRDLNVLYRMFVRVSSVEGILSRTARLWDAYNRNHGTIAVTMRSRTSADVTYEGIPTYAPPAFWAFQRGALRAVIEATGVRNARARIVTPPTATTPCVVRLSGERDP
jgi:hypothetical protein